MATLEALTPLDVTMSFEDPWEFGFRVIGDLDDLVGDITLEVTWPRGEPTTTQIQIPSHGLDGDQEMYLTQPFTRGSGTYSISASILGPEEDVLVFTCTVPGVNQGVTVTDVRNYLGASVAAWSDEDLELALRAEGAAQDARCRYPTEEPAYDLREALCRRVAVNLARRGLPLGMQATEVGAARLSTTDPEIRRLEQPYRKVLVG
ncbi:hypothetical protein [Nocardioides sp.]|uniref:hypothetical protein n=1 Tax=Nocardioides sp. TaxID=35761 RepID=UPI003783A952